MTQEMLSALAEKELSQVIAWAQDELKARAEQRRLETIAKIKAVAGTAGLSVTINGGAGGRQERNMILDPQKP